MSPGEGQAPSSVRGAGTTSQFQEVVLDPISGHDLSRHADPVSSVRCKTDRDKGRKSPQDHGGVSFIPGPPSRWDPQAVGTDAFLLSWDELQAYAFPPWSIIPRGPGEAACFSGYLSDVSTSVLAPEAMVSRAPGLGSGSSSGVTKSPRPSVSTPVGSASSRSPQASTSYLETLQRFTHAAGFSSVVASQVGLACQASSRTNYQLSGRLFDLGVIRRVTQTLALLSLRLQTFFCGFTAIEG